MTGEKATMDAPQIYVERTLAIVKPDAIHKSEEIEDIILRSGFAILQVKQYSSNFLYTKYVFLICKTNKYHHVLYISINRKGVFT